MKKILCIGSVTADVLVRTVDKLPEAGKLQGIDDVKVFPGGCAVNAALDLCALGANTELSCLVGDDSFGNILKLHFQNAGLSTKGVLTDGNVSTTVSVVLINSAGERSFLYNPGSAAAFKKEHILKELTDSSDIIFVAGQMILPSFEGRDLAEFMAEMKAEGKFTVMDTAWDKDGRWLERIKDALAYTDLFMPSREEASEISGLEDPEAMADFFFSLGCGSVVIKLGKQGALVCRSVNDRFYVPCFDGVEVVDTTGAGDAFCSGFLFGVSNGWDYALCAKFAAAVAACCIEKIGASSGIKSFEETKNLLKAKESDLEFNLI